MKQGKRGGNLGTADPSIHSVPEHVLSGVSLALTVRLGQFGSLPDQNETHSGALLANLEEESAPSAAVGAFGLPSTMAQGTTGRIMSPRDWRMFVDACYRCCCHFRANFEWFVKPVTSLARLQGLRPARRNPDTRVRMRYTVPVPSEFTIRREESE